MNLIVDMVFGSHLYGTASEKSDQDFKGVFYPEWRDVLLQRIPKSIHHSTKKDSESKNSPDDVESEYYSLNYFLHLACEGETVAFDMLHAPPTFWRTATPIWEELVSLRERFYTRSLKAFVGYARRQAAKYGVKGSRLSEARVAREFLASCKLQDRLCDVWDQLPTGEHIHKSTNENGRLWDVCGKLMTERSYCSHYLPMLDHFIERYGDRARLAESNNGIDWKAISHAFRAAYQVKHILTAQTYTYPLPEVEFLKQVKGGTMHFASEVAPKLDTLMDELEALSQTSTLPNKVDRVWWDEWLLAKLAKQPTPQGVSGE